MKIFKRVEKTLKAEKDLRDRGLSRMKQKKVSLKGLASGSTGIAENQKEQRVAEG